MFRVRDGVFCELLCSGVDANGFGMRLFIAADLFSDPNPLREEEASISRTIQFSTAQLKTILTTPICSGQIENPKYF